MDPFTGRPLDPGVPVEPKGKVLASYLVRVTLRDLMHYEDPQTAPTNDELEQIVGAGIFDDTAFHLDEIHVTSERVDR